MPLDQVENSTNYYFLFHKRSSLGLCIMIGKYDAADVLIQRRVNIDVADKDLMTPLHWAVRTGKYD